MREGDMQRSVMYVDLVKGRNASVNVGMHEDVGKLLGEIAEQMKYKTLFRAVAAQVGSRLTVTSAQLWQIRRGVVPFEVFRMVENGVELRPGTTLSRYNFPRNEDMQDEEVHLLVLTLEQPRVQPTWKPDEPLIHSLDEGRLAFANREAAVKTLQDVHAWNATGKNWKVPLADNDHGFGKTEFALHYVDQCKKTLIAHSANITSRHREVLTELSNCRTILIDGEPGQFVGKAPPNEVMNRALAEAITVKLEPGTAPSMTFTDSAKTFMSRIVKDLGPLFIVFDDIGPAFEDFTGQSVDSQKLFLRFYECVLAPWIATPKVYFLLLSQASFSRTIEWTPHEDDYTTAKSYDIARLPFSLFGRNHAEAILEETQVSRDDKRTLRGRWELTSRSSVDEAVELIVTASSGHPRTLRDMLIENPTFDDFRQYVDKGADSS